jgi:ribonuclease HI
MHPTTGNAIILAALLLSNKSVPGQETMNPTAHIRYADQQMQVSAPFDAAFVSELKLNLKSRRWDPIQKAWTINIREKTAAIEMIKRFFSVVEDNPIPETPRLPLSVKTQSGSPDIASECLSGTNLEIWTDGACHGNPGPGGYGIIFKNQGQTWAKSGGFCLTTNNRMEIMAAIVALETLKARCNVTLYSDSQYLVNAVTLGWARKWKANQWKRNNRDKALNPDLWDRLLELCEKHSVRFQWIKGHDLQTENEWCDQLAETAAAQTDLPADAGYASER